VAFKNSEKELHMPCLWKFSGSNRDGEKTARFSHYKSATCIQLPYASEQEMLSSYRELFPAEQGKSLAKFPADGIFGKDRL
jgi:hypothetical protein